MGFNSGFKGLTGYWMTLTKREENRNKKISSISHSLENSLGKRLQTCHKTEYVMWWWRWWW